MVVKFGAMAVVGGPAFLLLAGPAQWALQRKVAWLVGGGWLLQILSGIGFGVVSYTGYGSLPDIHGIAIAALYLKVLCALAGLVTTLALLGNASTWGGAALPSSLASAAGLGGDCADCRRVPALVFLSDAD